MSALAESLRDRIRRSGPIPVAEFMALALAHPEHGYYRARDPIGAAGDFVTAPEIGQVFGELIGLWCAVSWQQAGAPTPVRLVELGPGRGTLMADALRAIRVVPGFRDAVRIHMVETSPVLRARQRTALAGSVAGIEWHDSLDAVPDGPCLLIANEFFDALPVRQYVRVGAYWHERLVDLVGGELRFVASARPAVEALGFPPALGNAPDGAVFERSPAAIALMAGIGRRIARDGVDALAIDYGTTETAPGDSLQAVRRHRHHDVLADPGEADLTCHVDFATLGTAAKEAGAAVYGPIAQGTLLTRLGIVERTESLAAAATPAQADALRSACRRLIDADGMGTLFKALAVARKGIGAPPGFEV